MSKLHLCLHKPKLRPITKQLSSYARKAVDIYDYNQFNQVISGLPHYYAWRLGRKLSSTKVKLKDNPNSNTDEQKWGG